MNTQLTSQQAQAMAALKASLDNANAQYARLVRRDMRRGISPSEEMRTAYLVAKAAYRAYWAAVDANSTASL